MNEQWDVKDASSQLSELLNRVELGEVVTIAREGKPIARLVAVDAPARRELGFAAGGAIPASFFDELPEAELARWDGT